MKKKKFLLIEILILLILAFGITACGEKEEERSRRDRKERDDDDDDEDDDDDDDDDDEDDEDEDDDNHDSSNPLASYKTPEADWEGIYMTSSYADESGYVEVSIEKNGQLHFHVVFGKFEEDFYGEEQDYDESIYNWGGSYEATCYAYPEGDDYNSASFYYEKMTGDPATVSFSYYNNNDSYYEYLYEYIPWKQAPEDFVDEDPLGYLSEEYEGDEEYFTPSTDDYSLEFYLTDSLYDGDDWRECSATYLKSYDSNGFCIERITRYVFEDEADAEVCYKYYDKNYDDDYYEFNIVGNIIYKKEISSYYDTWDSKTGRYYWYIDCNYWYRPYDLGDNYAYYFYYSKPVTADEYNMDTEASVYFNSLGYGTFQCYEEKDVTLHVDIEDNYFDLGVYDYSYNAQYMISSSGAWKVDGKNIVKFTIDETYDNDENKYVYVPVIQEYVFEDDICTVTQYTFAASEDIPYDITLDNYSKKNAEDTLEYTFDLSKSIY